jgi:Mg/Co/Ni transporter MgtE
MAQSDWELEDRVASVKLSVDFHSQQLNTFKAKLDWTEREQAVNDFNMTHQIHCLDLEVRELRAQVDNLMKWEPWLMRVYRWWYSLPTAG